jgi:hypothetical protein
MPQILIQGADLNVGGQLTANSMLLPSASVFNTHVASAAGITAGKIQHQHRAVYFQQQGVTTSAHTACVHICKGLTGQIQEVKAMVDTVNANTASTGAVATVYLLPATAVSFTSTATVATFAIGSTSNTACQLIASGGLSNSNMVVGDKLYIGVNITAATNQCKGLALYADIYEDAV